jgi:hypothetical protein
MMGNCHVRFGGGPVQKCPGSTAEQLGSGLPYLKKCATFLGVGLLS